MKLTDLDFVINGNMHKPRVLRWHKDGCRPATLPEIEMWDMLVGLLEPKKEIKP